MKIKYVFVKLFAKWFKKTKLRERYKNNVFVFIKRDGRRLINPKIKGLTVEFLGKNNYLEIQAPIKIKHLRIVFQKNSAVLRIGQGCIFRKDRINLGENAVVEIGDRVTTQSIWLSAGGEKSKISIGSDCMFSHNINLRDSDGHTIYDVETNELLNPPEPIVIGNHVWVAMNVMFLKGAQIADNSVVGACSVVTKKFNEPNCVIAGQPAKVIRKGINWDKTDPPKWKGKINEF